MIAMKTLTRHTLAGAAALIAAGFVSATYAFDSQSDGTDGALDFTWAAGTTVVFDPSDPMTFEGKSSTRVLDADNDNVFLFSTIKIPANVTVVLRASKLNWKPVYWLATGDITISGSLVLDGQNGHPAATQAQGHYPAEPGPGGFSGGVGVSSINPAQPGFGPGGGQPAKVNGGRGGTGSHASVGNAYNGTAGSTYGSPFLLPIIGGSGGAGTGNGLAPEAGNGAGGGAGGGAIVLVSNTRVWLDGRISARGGISGDPACCYVSTDGSGGAVRILAPEFKGGVTNTYIDVRGGNYGGGGRIRIEANINTYTGAYYPDNATHLRVSGLVDTTPFLRTATDTRIPGWPSVKVSSINGVNLPPEPTASFTVPDATINTTATVPVVFTTENIPTTATISLKIVSPFDGVISASPTFTSGTQAGATWTADIAFPVNFSRGYVQATWTP